MKTLLILGLLGLAGCTAAEVGRNGCGYGPVSDVVGGRLSQIYADSNPTDAEWNTLLEWSQSLSDKHIRACYVYWIGIQLEISRDKRDQADIQQSIPSPPVISKEKQ